MASTGRSTEQQNVSAASHSRLFFNFGLDHAKLDELDEFI